LAGAGRRTYATLDAMRGVAAVMVVMRHATPYFGPGLQHTESYLAVDLFFGLSGFVLAHAYSERLSAGMGVMRFMAVRVARLHPLYLLGLALGGLVEMIALKSGHPALTLREIATAGALGALMLPSPPMGRLVEIFPLNSPSWSLFFEFVANAVMALVWKRLSDRVLAAICAVCGVGLAIAVTTGGTADLGFSWTNLVGGFLRVGFSFFLGILIYRKRELMRISAPPWVLLAALALALACTPPASLRPFYDLFWIGLGFPILIALAAQREPRAGAAVFRFLGVTSYAIYVLHMPLQRLLRGLLLKYAHFEVADHRAWAGPLLLAGLLAVCWAVDRVYDQPVRKALTGWMTARRRPAGPVLAREPAE
jgi:peptidoglycan/LPS O-acetylase OafA/YrhL